MAFAAAAQSVNLRKSNAVHTPKIANAVLGMLFFVTSEAMFFTALISAYLVIRTNSGAWVPPQNVRLSIYATFFNTCVLLTSGGLLIGAVRTFEDLARSKLFFLAAIVTGAFFVVFQGVEWVRLIQYGMTMKSGIFGACFFLLIGTHGLHAAAAVLAMSYFFWRQTQGRLTRSTLESILVFWGFIVLVWPVLFGVVYF